MNVQIPLNAYINTKDNFIIHDVESQDKDALQKKNTLVYQSTLSPMYTKDGSSSLYTTTGKVIRLTKSYVGSDEVETAYGTVNNVIDFSASFSGTIRNVLRYDNIYYVFVKESGRLNVYKYDGDADTTQQIWSNGETVAYGDINAFSTMSTAYVFACITYNGTSHKVLVMTLDPSAGSVTQLFGQNIDSDPIGSESSIYVYYYNHIFVGVDDKDARKRRTYMIRSDGTLLTTIRWFGCIGSNGLLTGEPVPAQLPFQSGANYESSFQYVFPISPSDGRLHTLSNGVLAYDTASDSSAAAKSWIDANASLKTEGNFSGTSYSTIGNTGVSRAPFSGALAWIGGYNLNYLTVVNGNLYGVALPISYIGSSASLTDSLLDKRTAFDGREVICNFSTKGGSYIQFEQVDLSDGLGSLEWDADDGTIEGGCNPFPYRYRIFNRAESRGVYWDYGPGWVRSYLRTFRFGTKDNRITLYQPWPTSIISWGLANHSYRNDSYFGTNTYRVEFLSPINVKTSSASYTITPSESSPYAYSKCFYNDDGSYKRFHLYNTSIFSDGMVWTEMVGADNLPNHAVLNSIPFNVRMPFGFLQQYYNGVYMSTSYMGTLLTSASVQNSTASSLTFPSTRAADVFDNGLFFRINRNYPSLKVEKISDYLYRTNTVTGNNLLVDTGAEPHLQRGFIGYNGEEVIYPQDLKIDLGSDNVNTDGNDTYYSATGYNVQMTDMTKRGVSYLLPAFQLPLCVDPNSTDDFGFQLTENKHELTIPFTSLFFTYKDDVLDHYYNHSLSSTSVTYQTGHKMESSSSDIHSVRYGIKTYDRSKADFTWWIDSGVQIFPLGIATPLTGINYIAGNVDMTDNYSVRLYRTQNVTFPVYNPNNEVYKSDNIFTIYGYNYSFDGQAIYYLGSGDDITQSNFTCYALGMKFLANSGTEAFFYSPFEKRLYLFTGSVTLQISDSLAREGDIVDSLYSSCEQILYLLTSEGRVLAKSQDDMCCIETVDPSIYHFESAESGCVLVGSDASFRTYRLYRTDETSWLPIEYETEYIGKNNTLYKLAAVEVTYFRGDGRSISGSFGFECMNDKLKTNEKIPFAISKKDWDESRLVKVKVTPKNNVVKAFKFSVKSDDYIHIANINVVLQDVSENTNAQVRK